MTRSNGSFARSQNLQRVAGPLRPGDDRAFAGQHLVERAQHPRVVINHQNGLVLKIFHVN